MLVAQSIPLCIAFAALGGALEVMATAVLAYADARTKQGKVWSPCYMRMALIVNITLQILASLAGNLIATWFGPNSIVGPIFFSAQLLTNMIVYGIALGLENFTKDMKIGTWVIVVSSVLLPIVGPQVQEDQDAWELISSWYSLVWSGILLVGMLGSAVALVFDISRMKSEWARTFVLLVARSTAFTINLTTSKPMAMKPEFTMLLIYVGIKIVSGIVMTYAIVVQSTVVTQSKFVPLNATTIMVVNAITGFIIWEDWRAVESEIGYAAVFALLLLGNYLLLGDDDFEMLLPEGAKYGRRTYFVRQDGSKRLSLFLSQLNNLRDSMVSVPHTAVNVTGDGVLASIKEVDEEHDNDDDHHGHITDANGDDDYDEKPPEEKRISLSSDPGTKFTNNPDVESVSSFGETHLRLGQRNSTARESRRRAWSQAFGLGEDFIEAKGGPNRQSIIF